MKKRILSGMGLVIAGTILGFSIWKSVDDQAYARVVPESVQEAMEAESRNEAGEEGGKSVLGMGSLPWEVRYYLNVAKQRAELLLIQDPVEQVRMRVVFANERVDMAISLAESGETSLAVKTANKGIHYLQYATNLWQETEMSEAEREELGGLIHQASVEQEVRVHGLKEGVVDLADSAVEELCERLTAIMEVTKG